MLVLVFRHIAMEHIGLIGSSLDAAGIDYQYVDVCADAGMPASLDAAAGLIFMGGPMSVNDNLSYTRRELGIIAAALAAGRPMLGVCLGAQLIASALGSSVYRNDTREIGWGPVYRTEAGRKDPLLTALSDGETVLHWHRETFDLPTGATWLAYSDACAQQAFRYGSNVYGIQFHLEATPRMIAEWAAAEVNRDDVRNLGAPIDPHAHQERMRELSALVFDGWARLVRAWGASAGSLSAHQG